MRPVAILGIGQVPVDEHWDNTLRDLAGEAALAALQDAKRERVDGIFVGNMLSNLLVHQQHLGAMLADWLGLAPVAAVKIESACGSGGAAFRAALQAVASGELDSALAVGVEKMTETDSAQTTAALAAAADADWETAQGLSFVAINALLMQRYLYEYGWQHQDFAPFAINAHANAVGNPNARLPHPINEQDYRKAKMIATPINLLDASPIGDGAAAVLLVPAEHVRYQSSVHVLASAATSDTIAVHDRQDPLWLTAAALSAQKAYRQASLSPAQIDFFEVHDAFSIMTALSLEACGFVERGQAPRLGLDGAITRQGWLPICTQGGLKARGHPVGATGLYQIVEAVQQLRGSAGVNQLNKAQLGLTQNIGGSGATVFTHILGQQPRS